MTRPPDDEATTPEPILADTYRGLDGRIIRLEEFRQHHEGEHDKHIATKHWVTNRMVGVAVTVATIVAILAAAALRGLIP